MAAHMVRLWCTSTCARQRRVSKVTKSSCSIGFWTPVLTVSGCPAAAQALQAEGLPKEYSWGMVLR